jgi:cytochrome bd ubiquinol oxidase subunit I
MILVMVLATAGALVSYLRGRMRFRYGSPATSYRVVLLALGVLAAVTALNMGFMKSNSRVPYTIYNQPSYTVQNETPPTGFGK